MIGTDALGWCAAALTVLTFAARDIRALRLSALDANLSFIAYGVTAQPWPVLALHLLLVPVNLVRLMQLRPGPAVPGAGDAGQAAAAVGRQAL